MYQSARWSSVLPLADFGHCVKFLLPYFLYLFHVVL